jgi:hypothetical protein
MILKIKRLQPGISLPEPATARAAGFDLAAAADVDIPPHGIRLVGTGLVIAVPDGYFLGIFARSSTPLKQSTVEWIASDSIAELPDTDATMNLVTAMATFAAIAPNTARLVGAREVIHETVTRRTLVCRARDRVLV